jgi:hypothetical protein
MEIRKKKVTTLIKNASGGFFTNQIRKSIKKSEFENDQLNGYSLFYKKNKLVKAEKNSMGNKIKEWNSISEFKRDNKISF